MVKTLLKSRADPNLKSNGNSALDMVMKWDSAKKKSEMCECVRLLIAANANVSFYLVYSFS